MKCPQCGRWNRSTTARCFYCAADLPVQDTTPLNWKSPEHEQQLKNMPKGTQTVIYEPDDENVSRAIPRPDDRDLLAREMQSLHTRRKRGEEQLRQVQQHTAQGGYVPLKSNVQTLRDEPAVPYTEPSPEDVSDVQPEGSVRPDAIFVASRATFEEDQVYDDLRDRRIPLYDSVPRQSHVYSPASRRSRRAHGLGLRRFAPFLAVFFFAVSAALCIYMFIIKPSVDNKEPSLQEQIRVTATILNDMAAHTIDIPAPDGSQIYIKELKKSYISAGGYASVTVADYTWYELRDDINSPTMDITLTPYIKTSAGEQKLMEPIVYTIDVPLSPITLVTPDTAYMEVTTSPYQIKFKVEQNSSVSINGVDFSSFVNTQDGYITYNATVPAVGENEFIIEVQCEYYRKNTVTLILYRAPQDIPLELDPTIGSTSADNLMTVKGTTIPGATITVTTPYESLDTSLLASTGEFSFKAKFEKIGTNVITIVAQKDEDSATLTKEVYYVPYASTYTPKAWAMDATDSGRANYLDYLNNTSLRVERTQVYVCSGEIIEIISHKPQLAIMDTNPSDEVEQLVLLENLSSDTWVVGQSYRVYGDAYGAYNGMPRLVGRYTYPPRN